MYLLIAFYFSYLGALGKKYIQAALFSHLSSLRVQWGVAKATERE